jgi:FkbM family methyltransferase
MNPFIETHGIRLLNVPQAQSLIDEVISGDCYLIDTIPSNCRVLDLGACYGEFAILAASLGFTVKAVEPSKDSHAILCANVQSNKLAGDVRVVRGAASEKKGPHQHMYDPTHPAGSGQNGAFLESVQGFTINDLTTGWDHWAIKMDVEGDEAGLFDSAGSWLPFTDWLSMEFHNHDGEQYAKVLREDGFNVQIFGGGPKQTRTPWDPSMTGGIVHAQRILSFDR